MDEKPRSEASSYFSVPESHWRDVGAEGYRDLSRVHATIGLALAELERDLKQRGEDVVGAPIPSIAPNPAELALLMHEVAGELLSKVASDEQDLRQIITTLRTAFAVTWDLYSFKESERITVLEHMDNLRARIDDFERELNAVRQAKRSAMS